MGYKQYKPSPCNIETVLSPAVYSGGYRTGVNTVAGTDLKLGVDMSGNVSAAAGVVAGTEMNTGVGTVSMVAGAGAGVNVAAAGAEIISASEVGLTVVGAQMNVAVGQ